MKPVAIISVGQIETARLESLDARPEFRKATLNMKMSYAALASALAPIQNIKDHWRERMALFLGTSHGEFNATLDFLKAWGEHRHARPFIFQNSLHNSTTGFVGLSEGTVAPSCTISHHHFSGEDAIDMACQFLITGACEIAAVIGVDARTVDQLPMMTNAGFPNADWGQGAGALILATNTFCVEHSLTPLGFLKSVEAVPNLEKSIDRVDDGFSLANFYDAHAIEELSKRIESRDETPMVLKKPNGGFSKIIWSAHV